MIPFEKLYLQTTPYKKTENILGYFLRIKQLSFNPNYNEVDGT